MNDFRNPLPGVPNIESPFFDEIFTEGSFSPEFLRIARDLNRDGYAVIEFPDSDLKERSQEIISELTRLLSGEHKESSGVMVRGSGVNPEVRVQDAWKINEHVRALACNQAILDLLTSLFGRRAWPFQTLNFPMGSQQHFHSDAVHFSSVPERFMCGVWIALEDIGEDQGPLEYYPGTHKWPIYTNEHIGRSDVADVRSTHHVFFDLWERLIARANIRREVFCARRSQALIWTANLLHGGMAHVNMKRTRWSQVTHYYFDDCAYYTPMSSDPFRGLVRFRQPTNVATGELMENSFNGLGIPADFLERASASPTPISREEFDAKTYLLLNPDVAAANMDPWQHYIEFGKAEGRPLR